MGSVDRGGERHFLWLQAQLVSTLHRCGCQIFIPTLETAGDVNTAPASVIPPHKTQSCVCAHSGPTVTTSRYHVDTESPSSLSAIPEAMVFFICYFARPENTLEGIKNYCFYFEIVKWPLENQESLVGFIIEHDKTQKKSYRGAFMPHLH